MAAMSMSAWLPSVKMAASGRPRRVMVKLMAILPDWVTMATPRSRALAAMFVRPQRCVLPMKLI